MHQISSRNVLRVKYGGRWISSRVIQTFLAAFTHGLINYIDTKAKFEFCHLKKFIWKGTFQQVFIRLRPPSLLSFCLGWSSNFVGSEIQSVKLLQNMVSNRNSTPPTPSHSHALSVCTVLWHGGGGGRVETERRLEGQQFTQLGRNTNMTDCISSL